MPHSAIHSPNIFNIAIDTLCSKVDVYIESFNYSSYSLSESSYGYVYGVQYKYDLFVIT